VKSSFWSVAILVAALSGASLPASFAHGEYGAPRLVLQLTVDGLRADRLTRNIDHLGAGGFRYLLDSGAVFTNAHYQHANTETMVGHATLAALLGMSPPASAQGTVLPEVFP
jgi:hypothetical protein